VALPLGTGLSIVNGTLTATGATNLSYDPATRLLSSSTGADVTLPLVSTTAAGLVPSGWLTGAEAAILPHIHGALAGPVYEHVRNVSGSTMAALTPYHIVGSQGDTDRVQVIPADASDPSSMPASGILMTALANNEDGHGVIAGVSTGLNTVANPSGTVLYVGTGVLTPTAPAANVQAIAIVGRSHASTGTLSLLQGPSLGNSAYRNIGTTAGTVAAGDDSRLSDTREWTATTVSQAEAEAGTETTRRAWTAQRVRQAIAAWWLTVTSSTGRSVVAAADAAAARTAIGAGTSNVAVSDATPQAPGTASAGTANSASRSDHRHALPATVSATAAGLAPATGFSALAYAATVDLDMAALDGQYRTITLTGDLSFTASSRATGRTVVLRLLPGATQRTLTFPVDWVFVSSKPGALAASRTAVLSLSFFGAANSDCVAAYAVQP
jgi:hypothetical protein